MSFNPVNHRDMINATHDALVHLGLVDDTPPSPVPLVESDEEAPSTPVRQIMVADPIRPPSVERPERRHFERDDFRPRVLNFNEAPTTPGNLPEDRTRTNRSLFLSPRNERLIFPRF